jgi:predicted RNase H-like HicB family nuclease
VDDLHAASDAKDIIDPMLTEYIEAAMRKAKYELLGGGEGFFARIPGYKGVWANASTLEACRDELREVLEDWILVRVRLGLSLPVTAGIDLNDRKPRKRKVA